MPRKPKHPPTIADLDAEIGHALARLEIYRDADRLLRSKQGLHGPMFKARHRISQSTYMRIRVVLQAVCGPIVTNRHGNRHVSAYAPGVRELVVWGDE